MTIHNTAIELKADLARLSNQLEIELTDVVSKVAFDAHSGIIKRTPVDTGRAAASWGMTTNAPDNSNIQPEGTYPDPSVSAASLIDVSNLDPEYPTYWIWNNLPYIQVLEFGLFPGSGPKTINGYSTQAPSGMVRVTLAEIETEITGLLRGVLRRRT